MMEHVLSLYRHDEGVETAPGPHAVLDLDADLAHYGAASIRGPALRWALESAEGDDALLGARVSLDPQQSWIMRCDRVAFPPGGIAYRHTHPGPGIRYLLFGRLQVEAGGRTETVEPGQAWFESGPEPVLATASETEPTAFVRVMLLPAVWKGRRTITYVDPADRDRPRRQSARIYFDHPVDVLAGGAG